MGFIKFIKAIGHFFEKLFGAENVKAFSHGALALLESAIGKIALDAVASLEGGTLDSEAKRHEAFARIKAEAEAAGLEVKDSIINLLIELAVQRIKGVLVH